LEKGREERGGRHCKCGSISETVPDNAAKYFGEIPTGPPPTGRQIEVGRLQLTINDV